MNKFVRLDEVIASQTPTIDGWICPDCFHWGGNLNCRMGFFISVVGANMKKCPEFTEKIKKAKERKEWRQNIKDSKT